MDPSEDSSKRTSRCPGCGAPASEHSWGIPSKFCEGEEKSSPRKPDFEAAVHLEMDSQICNLEEELANLDLEEERQAKQRKVQSLQRLIKEKRARIHQAAEQLDGDLPGSSEPTEPTNITDLKRLVSNQTPLDGLLQPLQQATSIANQCWNAVPSQAIGAQQSDTRQRTGMIGTSEMFLKPAQLPKGERVLKIIDFVDNIVPREDERTISDGGNTKLIVSYGPKKPKLEQVTLQQWVVSNTRIFYNLLANGKLQSHDDIQHYLAYTIKIMELANRFQWVSVLKYDDEFRVLQATYNYPWSFDSNHLHTVLLEPIPKTPLPPRTGHRINPANPNSQFIATTNEGRTICRNFNSSRGCSFTNCVFEHVCNRRAAGGKACGLNHSGYSHNFQGQQPAKPSTQ